MAGEKKTKTTKVAGKTASKTTGKAASKAPVKTPSKAPSKTSGKTTGKTPVKAPAKAPGKAADKASKTPAKTATKTISKALVRPPSRPASKAPVKPVIKEKPPQITLSKEEWDAFTEKMDKLLQDEKSEIINTLMINNKDFKEIVDGMDPKDLADIASDDIDRRMIEMLGSQELKRLKLIESAQTRIKQGKYGHCIKCDRLIPPERLEAIPYALMCIECKSEEERRNR
jgi:RNA polymerase-binding transcription factor DksA